MSLIYLASPYSHEDPKVREERFILAVEFTAQFILEGYNIYSPIIHGHHITECLIRRGRHLQYQFKYNEKLCMTILKRCDAFWILEIDGWKESVGIKRELVIAEMLHMPIKNIPIHIRDRGV